MSDEEDAVIIAARMVGGIKARCGCVLQPLSFNARATEHYVAMVLGCDLCEAHHTFQPGASLLSMADLKLAVAGRFRMRPFIRRNKGVHTERTDKVAKHFVHEATVEHLDARTAVGTWKSKWRVLLKRCVHTSSSA